MQQIPTFNCSNVARSCLLPRLLAIEGHQTNQTLPDKLGRPADLSLYTLAYTVHQDIDCSD